MVFPMTAQEQTVPPILSMEPPWDRFLTGDKIILKCDAGKNLRSRSYMWKINNQSDIVGKETYIIEAANKSDNGLYKCKTTSGSPNLSTSYSNVIHVNISELVSHMSIEAVPRIVWADQRLLLRCNYSFPIGKGLIYTFYREHSIVTETPVLNETATLELRNVTLEDKGRYRCEVRYVGYPNGPVYSSNYTHVVIKETPVRITVDPEVPEDGDNITLRCLCTDDLACGSRQYSFYRNNALVNSDSVSHNEYRIQTATVMDSGWYHCAILSSSLTHTAKSVQITVKGIPVANPHLHISPLNGRVREGSNLTLRCSVNAGSPPMDFTWYREGKKLHMETSSSREVTHQIYHFKESIEGNYSCSVFNNMKSAVYSAGVDVKAEVAVSCPSLTSNLSNSFVAVEDKVRFTCRSPRGTPPIHYQLYRDQCLLANTTVSESGPGIFIITLQEGGMYSCGAANEMADVTNCSENVHLTVAVPVVCPDVASDWSIPIVAIGDRVTLTCKSQRGTPPIDYMFYRDRQIIANQTAIDSRTGNLTFTVESEAEGGLYSCGANNGFGPIVHCGKTMVLKVTASTPQSFLLICVAAVVSFLVLILLILLTVCKTRRNKKGNCNQTGLSSSLPLHNSNTPAENSAPPCGEIVYAEVQVKRKTDGHDGDRARKNPVRSDYYVTYASLDHLQMKKNHKSALREGEEGDSPEYRDIYQNVQRS
ncbi:Fc receptor-like protein 3 isoform X2 [Mustelus asterias]